jgi:hypothetical protein
MRFPFIRLFLVLFICFAVVACVNTESLSPFPVEDSSYIKDAKSLFAHHYLQTKATQIDSSFFKRLDFTPLWQSAVVSETEAFVYIDVPVRETARYHMVFYDGLYYRLTESHFSLTFIKDKQMDSIFCFNHFFLPQMNSVNWPGHFDEDLYMEFLCNSSRNGYTGLEIYTNPQGRFLSMDVYDRGEKRSHTDAIHNEDGYGNILSFFETFTALAFKEIKTKSNYVCPICGGEYFWEHELLGYICIQCFYTAFYEGELEAAQIIGNYGGDYGDLWTDWPDYPWDDFPPSFPEGGNSGSGNSGSSGSPPPSYTNSSYSNNSFITLSFPSDIDSNSFYIQNFLNSLDSIYSNPVLQTLVGALDGLSINFILDFSIPAQDKALTNRITREIRWRDSSPAVITEELFHIYQYQNLSFRSRDDAYFEFEAKCLLVEVYGLSALYESQGNNQLWDAAYGYLVAPSDQSFIVLKEALSFWGGYNVSQLFYLSNDMLPNMNNLGFDTDERP